MASKFNDEDINPNKEDYGGSNHKIRYPKMKTLQNMEAYCSSHGFHPVRLNHESTTCSRKKAEHKTEATWSNRLGGDICMWLSNNRHTPHGKEKGPHELTSTGDCKHKNYQWHHISYNKADEEAIHIIYKLKTPPELIRYHHAAAGFPT